LSDLSPPPPVILLIARCIKLQPETLLDIFIKAPSQPHLMKSLVDEGN
jgi:hypothetical protein